MGWGEVLSAIANMAFPAVMCVLLFVKLDKDQQATRELMAKRDDQHKEEVDGLKEVIEELKATLDKILTVLKLNND